MNLSFLGFLLALSLWNEANTYKKYTRLYHFFLAQKELIIDKHQRLFLDICIQRMWEETREYVFIDPLF